MGITGLLSTLKSITIPAHLSNYKGLVAGVDAMGWLHRAIHCNHSKSLITFAHYQHKSDSDSMYSPPLDEKTKSFFVSYVLSRCELLTKNGLEPLLVIDGAPLPSKRLTDLKRKEDRKASYEKAVSLERRGDLKEARIHFARSLSVSLEMRKTLVDALKKKNINFIISPYEADAQLAYFSQSAIVDVVISEDGDCIPYGCSRVFFKMDNVGNGEEIQQKNLGSNEELKFANWTHDQFVSMCILSGCDYCPGVYGLGIKKAYKIVKVHRKPNKIAKAVRQLFGAAVPADFEMMFARSFLTFRHQTVYNVETRSYEMLTPANKGEDYWYWSAANAADSDSHTGMGGVEEFLGAMVDDDLAQKVVNGDIHPVEYVSWGDGTSLQADPSCGVSRDMRSYFDQICGSAAKRQQQTELENIRTEGLGSEMDPKIVQNNDDKEPQSQVDNPITSEHYSSSLVGNGFETITRCHRRKRLVANAFVRTHMWALEMRGTKRRKEEERVPPPSRQDPEPSRQNPESKYQKQRQPRPQPLPQRRQQTVHPPPHSRGGGLYPPPPLQRPRSPPPRQPNPQYIPNSSRPARLGLRTPPVQKHFQVASQHDQFLNFQIGEDCRNYPAPSHNRYSRARVDVDDDNGHDHDYASQDPNSHFHPFSHKSTRTQPQRARIRATHDNFLGF